MNPDSYLVAVDAPLREALTYLPSTDGSVMARGQSVLVPLGKRKAHGVVVKPATNAAQSEFKLKPIFDRNEERPLIPPPYMDWLE